MNTYSQNKNNITGVGTDILKKADPELFGVFEKEYDRQTHHLELIASENYVSPAVLEAQGSILTNKYAEGYPGKRYYGGCEYVDMAETLAQERLAQLFGAQAQCVNVQPHSGSGANMAVFMSVLKPGDKILGMDLSHGGHLTHGSPVNFSGFLFEAHHYGVSEKNQRIDFDQVRDTALKVRPKMIIAGASAYARTIDFQKFSEIAKSVDAVLMVDMAHVAGLVAAGLHPNPVAYADYTTSTTHKTLRGPRGGVILSHSVENIQKINKKIFPGIQGGPLMHVIAAKAVCFKEALSPGFKKYAGRVIQNAQTLAEVLLSRGYSLVTGGTDNHLLLLDFTKAPYSGKEVETALNKAGLNANRNTVPFDHRSPFVTSGVRLGAAALTSRGFDSAEFKQVGLWIDRAIQQRDNEDALKQIYHEVRELGAKFPLFKAEE